MKKNYTINHIIIVFLFKFNYVFLANAQQPVIGTNGQVLGIMGPGNVIISLRGQTADLSHDSHQERIDNITQMLISVRSNIAKYKSDDDKTSKDNSDDLNKISQYKSHLETENRLMAELIALYRLGPEKPIAWDNRHGYKKNAENQANERNKEFAINQKEVYKEVGLLLNQTAIKESKKISDLNSIVSANDSLNRRLSAEIEIVRRMPPDKPIAWDKRHGYTKNALKNHQEKINNYKLLQREVYQSSGLPVPRYSSSNGRF
jgi:hypothetical protein